MGVGGWAGYMTTGEGFLVWGGGISERAVGSGSCVCFFFHVLVVWFSCIGCIGGSPSRLLVRVFLSFRGMGVVDGQCFVKGADTIYSRVCDLIESCRGRNCNALRGWWSWLFWSAYNSPFI